MDKSASGDAEPPAHDESSAELQHYVMHLYITGSTPNSARAIVNVRNLCEEYIKGRYELEVVDLCKDPAAAQREQIIAAPTLVKKSPLPLRRFIGDMSKTERILRGLDICVSSHKGAA